MRVGFWNPQKADPEIMHAAMDRLEKVGELIAEKARGYVPVDTGRLRASIRVRRLHGDPTRNIRIYAGNRIKGGPFYAHMVEYGTRKMKKRQFLRPALDHSKSEAQAILSGA